MTFNMYRRWLFGLLVIFLIGGCASGTRIFYDWKDNAYTGGPVKSVLIVGVAKKAENRKLFEEKLADRLNRSGIRAEASVNVLPSGEKPTKEMIKAEAKKLQFETIMVTHLLGVDKEPVFHPQASAAVPGAFYSHFDSYFRHVDTYIHYPGEYKEQTFVKLETNLYQTESEQLIWKAASETVDPKSITSIIDSLVTALTKNMRSYGLLP